MESRADEHERIRAALVAAGVNAVDGPADDLPPGDDGMVAQAAVLWPSPGQHQYQRASGQRSGRGHHTRIVCVGATTNDALEVADQVEAAIGGMSLSSKGGTLRQTDVTDPAPEPNADPRRVSLSVEYSAITKGPKR